MDFRSKWHKTYEEIPLKPCQLSPSSLSCRQFIPSRWHEINNLWSHRISITSNCRINLDSRYLPSILMKPTNVVPCKSTMSYTARWHFNSRRSSDAYMRQWINRHWFRQCLVARPAPSHYVNKCWNIVIWIHRNKLEISTEMLTFLFT